MKEESEETYVFAPQITQKSVNMMRNRDISHDGSTIMSKRKMSYLQEKSLNETFKPKINSRSNSISEKYDRSTEALYQDAMRRQNQQQTISTIMSQKAQADKNTAQISAASDKFIFEKFDSDFTNESMNIGLLVDENDTTDEKMVDCPKMSWLFLSMGFVKSNGSDED